MKGWWFGFRSNETPRVPREKKESLAVRNIEVRDCFPAGPPPRLASPPPIPPPIGDRGPVGDLGLDGECRFDDDAELVVGLRDDGDGDGASTKACSGTVLARVNTVGLGFVSLDETEPGEAGSGPDDEDIASASRFKVV